MIELGKRYVVEKRVAMGVRTLDGIQNRHRIQFMIKDTYNNDYVMWDAKYPYEFIIFIKNADIIESIPVPKDIHDKCDFLNATHDIYISEILMIAR